uniref:DUF6594 domain-containing protein n=1 Tax=Colletotrichum fructicola (strain Nara gc5) TaxID=1213859 RepID=L2FEW3_COLFN
MAKENEVAIFRRFDHLNFLSLLSLQSEIIQLEVELRIVSRVDDDEAQRGLSIDTSQYAKNFKILRESGSSQYTLLEKLRGRLREYRPNKSPKDDLAIQLSQVNQIGPPAGFQLEMLKDWLRDQKLDHPFLQGHEAQTWASDEARLYMCLKPKMPEDDYFTRFVSNFLLRSYNYLRPRQTRYGETVDETSGHISYDNHLIRRISNLGTTLVACVMPVLTIFVLNIVPSTNLRILVTSIFTTVFALLIATFSNAKKVEIFAATATFATVEVVFIGSAIGSK